MGRQPLPLRRIDSSNMLYIIKSFIGTHVFKMPWATGWLSYSAMSRSLGHNQFTYENNILPWLGGICRGCVAHPYIVIYHVHCKHQNRESLLEVLVLFPGLYKV